ncbi:MAG: 4-hydroxy-3-methylbut-2-enyl diphosphate reductase [Bacilli bacterium]
METYIVKPCGYCLGVSNAIALSLEVKKNYPTKNVYIFGMLVHNNVVATMLKNHGIITIDTSLIDKEKRLIEFTSDDVVIFTAHGHNEIYEEILKKNHVLYFDSTCRIVKKNIALIKNYLKTGDVIYIGKRNHPETEASLSVDDRIVLYDVNDGFDPTKIKKEEVHVVNQTTLSFIELADIHKDILHHFPSAVIEDEICGATRVRQTRIASLKDKFDLFVIIGSLKSSNTDKLYQIAKEKYPFSLVIKVETKKELMNYDLSKCKKACLASGTSTPLSSIEEIENYLKEI